MSSITDLRKRVKELRGAIVGSVASAGEEELKREIAYHESAAKSAERDKKRGEALAKAREVKIAKGKAKKEAPQAEKEPKAMKEPKAAKEPKAVKEPKPEVKAMVARAIPKAEKMVKAAKAEPEAVLSKHIRVSKSKKDVEESDE